MNTLEKKLMKISDESHKENQEVVLKEAKLLLAANEAEERRTLVSIGLDNDLKIVESKNEEIIIRNTHSTKLGKRVLHIKDIKKLCLTYRLYMKKAKDYIGTIPTDLGAELNRFCKEKNIPLPSSSDHSDFYIIAPPKMFDGYSSPFKVVTDALDIAIEREKERIRLRNQDPILVYKVDQHHYAVIKSWGSDFTPIRKIYGFFTKRKNVNVINILTHALVAYGLLKLAIGQTSFFIDKSSVASAHHHDGSGWWALLVVINIAIIVAGCMWFFNDFFKNLRSEIIETVTKHERKFQKTSDDY